MLPPDNGRDARELRGVIQREIRRTVPLPVVRDTQQQPVTDAAAVTRTGAATWLVDYDAVEGTTPENYTTVWTPVSTGSPTALMTGGPALHMEGSAADALYYHYAIGALDPTKLTFAEGRLKVSSADSGVNQGCCFAVWNGEWQYLVWFRDGGFNVDGEADVAEDFTYWRRVMMVGNGSMVDVYVDGVLRQSGRAANSSTTKEAAFGTWVPCEIA